MSGSLCLALYKGMYRKINISMFSVEKPRDTWLNFQRRPSRTHILIFICPRKADEVFQQTMGGINQEARCTDPASRDELNWSRSQTLYIIRSGRFNTEGRDKGISVKHSQTSQTATYQRTDEEKSCSAETQHKTTRCMHTQYWSKHSRISWLILFHYFFIIFLVVQD